MSLVRAVYARVSGPTFSLSCRIRALRKHETEPLRCPSRLLFDEPDDNRLRKLIRNGANNPKLPATYSRELESVMRSMLATNVSLLLSYIS